MSGTDATSTNWRPIAATSDHALAPLVRREVGQGVQLIAEAGGQNRVGAERFRLFIESTGLGRTSLPIAVGLMDLESVAGPPWIEVTNYRSQLPLGDGREVEVPEGIMLQLIAALAEQVPPGGSLVFEYDSPALLNTAAALAAGVPPVATPLGGMLYAAGCGVAFRDRGAAAGSRTSARRLQGFRAIDDVHLHRRGVETLDALEGYMAQARDLDWQVQSDTRPIAEATITALREKLAVPEGPLPPA